MDKSFFISICKLFISEQRRTLKSIPRKHSDYSLVIKHRKGHFRFFRAKKGSKVQEYLGKTELKTIMELAQHEYEKEVELETKALISTMEKFILKLEMNKDAQEVYDSLPDVRKTLVSKITTTDIQGWREKYRELPWNIPEHLVIMTKKDNKIEACDGTMVKSKSEALIIKVCVELGIPYVYEYPLKANGVWYFPDFRILNTRTGKEYIYEHLGGMDDVAYIEKNLFKKFKDYEVERIDFSTNLVCTFENKNHPLSEKDVKKMARKHFL